MSLKLHRLDNNLISTISKFEEECLTCIIIVLFVAPPVGFLCSPIPVWTFSCIHCGFKISGSIWWKIYVCAAKNSATIYPKRKEEAIGLIA